MPLLIVSNRYTFSRLPFLEKKERVTDLFHYVLGIRIFNLFLGKVPPPRCPPPLQYRLLFTRVSQGGADLSVAPHLARTCLNEVATSVLQVCGFVCVCARARVCLWVCVWACVRWVTGSACARRFSDSPLQLLSDLEDVCTK